MEVLSNHPGPPVLVIFLLPSTPSDLTASTDTYRNASGFIRELIARFNENRNRLFHFHINNRSELDLDIIAFAHGYFTSSSPKPSS